MTLISCPDCGKEISDLAPACPSCGRPIKATTIEATGKTWKKLQLVYGSLIIMGFFAVFSYPFLGGLLCVAGLAGFVRARLGAWWQHG